MKALFPFLVLLTLCGCATGERVDAAFDVHSFLVAVRDNDRPAFDAHVDRPAIARQIEGVIDRQVQDRSRSDGARALGALLGPTLARAGADLLIQPSVFRAGAVMLGYSPDKPIPGSFAIAGALRPAGDGAVCAAKKTGPEKTEKCLLTFAREDGTWRLVGFDPAIVNLKR